MLTISHTDGVVQLNTKDFFFCAWKSYNYICPNINSFASQKIINQKAIYPAHLSII